MTMRKLLMILIVLLATCSYGQKGSHIAEEWTISEQDSITVFTLKSETDLTFYVFDGQYFELYGGDRNNNSCGRIYWASWGKVTDSSGLITFKQEITMDGNEFWLRRYQSMLSKPRIW